MDRYLATIVRVLMPVVLLSCGGDSKKSVAKPVGKSGGKLAPPKETEADREHKRHAAALAIVPEGSTCLPASFKEPGAPQLDLAAMGLDLVVCAMDTDPTRLLGPIACWKVNVGTGGLTSQVAAALPGHGISVKLDDHCARGFCLPREAKVTAKVAHMAWNATSSKVAVLAGDEVHMFDAGTKAHESMFSIRGDKGVANEPTAVHWVGDSIMVEGGDAGSSGVWMFKVDGTPIGPIEALGSKDGKPMQTHGGSFSIIDGKRVAVAEQGYTSMTIYEVDTSKRTKLVRKLSKPPCKNDELDAYWHDNAASLPPKCKDHMAKNFEHLIGAPAVATAKSYLVMLRGPRTGEIGVLDQKTLAEKKAIKLPWCSAAASDAAAVPEEKETAVKTPAPKPGSAKGAPAQTRAKTDAKAVKGAEDPDAGGQ